MGSQVVRRMRAGSWAIVVTAGSMGAHGGAAEGLVEGGMGGGGPLDTAPLRGHEGAECISAEQRARADAAVEAFFRAHPEMAAGGSTLRGAEVVAQRYPFFPMSGRIYRDLFFNNFVDLNGATGILDWDCTNHTYDGHRGHDVDLRSFGEQAIGVPIFAALDGMVVDTDDGHFDMQTQPSPSAPANFVIIGHGNGQVTYYWHMRNGSVAVLPGQQVKAGQQIGLCASSGYSTGPHLHFETRQSPNVVEPFAGACRAGESGWVDQMAIHRDLFIRDFGVTHESLAGHPGLPWELPRSGQIALSDPLIYLWFMVGNLPANSTWRTRFIRPNGTTAFDSGAILFQGGNPAYRSSWWWQSWNITDLHSIAGSWRIRLDINGVTMIDAPVEARMQRTEDFNRPPAAISISFSPPEPAPEDVVFCVVETDLVHDDPDYDIVRYEYAWWVAGVEVRRVISAGHSDAIPRDAGIAGRVLRCEVTPMDGHTSGPTASAEFVYAPPCFDQNGDGAVNSTDLSILLGVWGTGGGAADLNGDDVVNSTDLALLLASWGACG